MVPLNMPNCSKSEDHVLALHPPPQRIPHILFPWAHVGSEQPYTESGISFQCERRQTPTHGIGWFWDCRIVLMPSGSCPVRYFTLEEETGTKAKNAQNTLKMRLLVAMAVMLIVNPHHCIWKQKRRWFKAAGGSAMGMLWPSEDTWRDGRHCEVLLLAGTSYGSTPSHGCFRAAACLSAAKAWMPPKQGPHHCTLLSSSFGHHTVKWVQW